MATSKSWRWSIVWPIFTCYLYSFQILWMHRVSIKEKQHCLLRVSEMSIWVYHAICNIHSHLELCKGSLHVPDRPIPYFLLAINKTVADFEARLPKKKVSQISPVLFRKHWSGGVLENSYWQQWTWNITSENDIDIKICQKYYR